MSDPGAAAPPSWLLFAALALLTYRGAMGVLLSAFHAMPSLHRRRLLEEGAIDDVRLAMLLEQPRALGMGLAFWNQLLLLLLLALLWPFHPLLPGGAWTLAALLVAGLWLLDLLLPSLLTARDPALWLGQLYPLYAPALARLIDRRQAEERARDDEDEDPSEEAVTALLEEGEAEGILEAEDRELIRNVVTFGDTVVREVMTPRTRIVALPLGATLAQAWEAFSTSRHSRLPVYEGGISEITAASMEQSTGIEQVKGILLLKDLLQVPDGEKPALTTLLKPARFVPESKPVADLLRELQRARTQLALVVDEFGGVSGLVTMEDLLEEVFGEIQDEHEAPVALVEEAPGRWLVRGEAHVEDVAQALDLSWERDGFDTLGGLVMARLGRVPRPQEAVAVEGARLTVLRMEGTRIVQVRVERTAPGA